jgi:predicted anti-sigma-YlaC factor YlaD
MNCNDHQQMISRLLDGEMSQSESTALFRHLSECSECRGFYHQLQTLEASLDQFEEHLPKPIGTWDHSPQFRSPLKAQPIWSRHVSLRFPVLALLLCGIAAGILFSFLEIHKAETVYVTRLPAVVITPETTTGPVK